MTAPQWSLHHGEAWECLRSLSSVSAEGFVTDPPYSSGGFTRGDRMGDPSEKYSKSGAVNANEVESFGGDNRDQRAFHQWCSLWLTEGYRVVTPGGRVLVATDWRQLPTVCDAIQVAGFVWRGVAVWTKKGIGRHQKGRFRGDAEFFVWGSKGPLTLEGPVLPGTFESTAEELEAAAALVREAPEIACGPVPAAHRLHLTEKPVEVMEAVLAYVPKGRVIDPFAGSGSTAVAALRRGLQFAGCEVSPHYHALATRRLQAEAMGVDGMVAARDGQLTMGGSP